MTLPRETAKGGAGEAPETRLKRLKMRSMRRGIKEMDMILGHFAEAGLASLSPDDLDLYERMLAENDHDLYAWFSGRLSAPAIYASLIAAINARKDLLARN